MKTVHGVKTGQEALFAAREWTTPATHLLLLPDDRSLSSVESAFSLFAPLVEPLVLPGWDCLPYDRLSPKADVMGQRLRVLSVLQQKAKTPRVVLCAPAAMLQRLPHNKSGGLSFAKNKDINFTSIPETLTSLGFNRTLTVREPGEFAIRGDLLDIYPPHLDEPVRIAFFGDQIETMDHFDPLSQRRSDKADSFTLSPASEVRLSSENIAHFREGYRDAFGAAAGQDPIYQAISEGRGFPGMEHYLPLFDHDMQSVMSLVDDMYLADGAQAALLDRLSYIRDLYQARASFVDAQVSAKKDRTTTRSPVIRPLPSDALYLSQDEVDTALKRATSFSAFADPGQEDKPQLPRFATARQASVHDAVQLAAVTIRDFQRQGYTALYSSIGPSGLERMETMLHEYGFTDTQIKAVPDADGIKALKRDQMGLVQLPLEHGFVDDKIMLLTEGDVFGDRLQQKPKKRRASDTFFKEFTSLQPGDLVVHRDHGIGRFDGLEAVNAAGAAHDCLRLVYENGDKLFVPVEAMDVLSRYGEDEGTVTLDKLGSASWQTRKARVKKNVLEIADKLLAVAAQRQLREATIYAANDNTWHEFCARFPYAETDDQLRAIGDVLEDLKAGRPMDRLVCGDVGFGKTEVALRAAFVVAHSGEQVAVTVPTTLLARQHFENFTERFAGFGLKVAELTRLSTPKENADVKAGLADGSIDVVVGTHGLLSEKIEFKRLGLVIVDEEQRFGVKQKERLKDLQKDVHVLTLTATPIPRTLQMALSGVRDLSLITTAPIDRLAARTFVAPFDQVMLREALMRERHRSGQSFIVCPRVSDLEDMEKRLEQIVPELSFITAHGQLPTQTLEERMSAFVHGEYDILLSTTIIESGLDIPRANTMIIHRADMFGLAQLYQLRGRIGRSKQRGYAYLTFEADVVLTETAQKRLHVLESLDQLGGGFQLASHDMDIRGAGNLLGDAQSGHVKEVGIELYQQMLEDAVTMARAGGSKAVKAAHDDWTPTINLGLPVLIPEVYVPDLSVRIALYRRLADMKHEIEIDSFADELVDRFGKLPDEVRTLLETIRIKAMCVAANIEKIDAGPKGALIAFRNDAPANPSKVFETVNKLAGLARLRPDNKVALTGAFDNATARIKAIRRFCEMLVLPEKSGTLVA